MTIEKVDCIIIGAGAAGLMCAIEAGKRGRRVMVLDHTNKPGKKILISGGGRCNFTNYHIQPDAYLSHNPHFCKSALSRYTQWHFIDLVKKHHIPFHEKTLGQLFCDDKSKAIVDLLLDECEKANVTIRMNATIEKIEKINDYHFKIKSTRGEFHCESLVIASGGLSFPTMGASPFSYKVAEQFGIRVHPTRAGLVPLTLHDHDKATLETLSGVAFDSIASCNNTSFRENTLFTHRGLSGPAILQISSYWQSGHAVKINMLPQFDVFKLLMSHKKQNSPKQVHTILSEHLPKRIIEIFLDKKFSQKCMTISSQDLQAIGDTFNKWEIKPNGTEGYRTAEVTLGGIDCDALSSKTMMVTAVPGLYFIGEAVDVTGWLGGYNFQWAWSSGWAAGQVA